jgi:hypothetical protein
MKSMAHNSCHLINIYLPSLTHLLETGSGKDKCEGATLFGPPFGTVSRKIEKDTCAFSCLCWDGKHLPSLASVSASGKLSSGRHWDVPKIEAV